MSRRLMCRSVMLARLMFEPSWTIPCTGMIAAGGRATAITASSKTPPPIPSEAVTAEFSADTAISIRLVSAGRSAGSTSVSSGISACSLASGSGIVQEPIPARSPHCHRNGRGAIIGLFTDSGMEGAHGRQYSGHTLYRYYRWREPWAGAGCHRRWLPPWAGAVGSGSAEGSGPAQAGHQPTHHPASGAGRGRDPLRRVRGAHHRLPDRSADPQYRPEVQGLLGHPEPVPSGPRGLHLPPQIR